MNLRVLLVSAAAGALASGAAAQTTTNTSAISQTGTDNRLAVDNNRLGNEQNRSAVVQNGRRNLVTVLQIGTLNSSQARQVGNDNVIAHSQRGDANQAESIQDGDANGSAVRQGGEFNSAIVAQEGSRNGSRVAQGLEAGSTRDFDGTTFFDVNEGVLRRGNSNKVTVSQVGNDLFSTIRQRAGSSGVAANENTATLRQRGIGSSSTIVQESRGNIARVGLFEGGTSASTRNVAVIGQQNTSATSEANPVSNNRADVAIAGQGNSATVVQNGLNNAARLSVGVGQLNQAQVNQSGAGDPNTVGIGQYGQNNRIVVAQASIASTSTIWQRIASRDNSVDIRQGTGATATDSLSSAFFNNTAPAASESRALVANVVQGHAQASSSWNVAQVRQDGANLSAAIIQMGVGTASLPNIVRVAQQGGVSSANRATAVQSASVSPSTAAESAPTGQLGDEFFFAGGARSAEINILQSGSGNTASVEQRGRGQFARIEQGPGFGNTASILQEEGATNATAVVRQTGSNNSYSVQQAEANQYILVSQTGNNNAVSNVIRRGPGS